MPLFEAQNITKVYQDRTVLDIAELLLKRERIYALQGPNGSGKTTLLEILGLLVPPSSGRLFYEGKSVDFMNGALTLLRREIVMVHQNPVLFTTTVQKNLEFGLKVRGTPRPKREKIVTEALELVGMRAFLRAEAHKLSGGETQRVAIARALACRPKVMLFDEPTASVDVENTAIIERIIRDINEERRISVVFTSHDLNQASRLSHEVIPLFEGKKVASLYENIFTATVTTDEDGARRCRILDGVSVMAETAATGKVKISIDPLKVKIEALREGGAASGGLKGRLFQLTDENSLVRASVDVGIPLNVLMTKEAFKKQPLTIGEQVAVLIPKESVTVFSQ